VFFWIWINLLVSSDPTFSFFIKKSLFLIPNNLLLAAVGTARPAGAPAVTAGVVFAGTVIFLVDIVGLTLLVEVVVVG